MNAMNLKKKKKMDENTIYSFSLYEGEITFFFDIQGKVEFRMQLI